LTAKLHLAIDGYELAVELKTCELWFPRQQENEFELHDSCSVMSSGSKLGKIASRIHL